MGHSAVSAFAGDTLIYVGDLPDDLTGGVMEPRWSLAHRSGIFDGASASVPSVGEPSAPAEAAQADARDDVRPCSTSGPLLHDALRWDWLLERRMAVPQWPLVRSRCYFFFELPQTLLPSPPFLELTTALLQARDTLTVWKRRDGAQRAGQAASRELVQAAALGASRPLSSDEQGRAAKLRRQILDQHRRGPLPRARRRSHMHV